MEERNAKLLQTLSDATDMLAEADEMQAATARAWPDGPYRGSGYGIEGSGFAFGEFQLPGWQESKFSQYVSGAVHRRDQGGTGEGCAGASLGHALGLSVQNLELYIYIHMHYINDIILYNHYIYIMCHIFCSVVR